MRQLAARIAVLLLLPPLAGAEPAPAPAIDPTELKAGVFSPPRAAPEFTLKGSDGLELTLGQYRGKVVVLGFGFTSCPDICPTTLATLARMRKQLGADAEKIQVIYVTVDPERDDASRLREYLAGFDPSFVGGTGSAEQLAAVREQYGIEATRKTLESSYAFAHSSYTYLIDRQGALRALMPYGHPADDYVHDVRILLAP